MNVVEVGCGTQAGPYWETADEYWLVDNVASKVTRAAQADPRYRTLTADASHMPQFADTSVDVVLARNVFGDPHLGASYTYAMEVSAGSDVSRTHDEVHRRKLAMLHEAGRILTAGGSLVIVEQYTTQHAIDFLGNVTDQALAAASLSRPLPVELQQATPANYAAAHSGAYTWLARKQ